METLRTVVASMRKAADAAGVALVTGDTKVVDRGNGDGMFITTAGVGVVEDGRAISPASGPAGRRGDRQRRPRRARHRDPLGARGPGVRGRDRERHGAAVGAGRGAARGGHRGPLPARPHARRPGLGAQRDRHGARRAASRSRRPASRCGKRCAAPARSWGSIRSTWPTRDASWRSSPARDAERALDVLRALPVTRGATVAGRVDGGGAGRGDPREPHRRPRAWWTCSAASSCPGSAKRLNRPPPARRIAAMEPVDPSIRGSGP